MAEATEARRALADAARPRSECVATDPYGQIIRIVTRYLQVAGISGDTDVECSESGVPFTSCEEAIVFNSCTQPDLNGTILQ